MRRCPAAHTIMSQSPESSRSEAIASAASAEFSPQSMAAAPPIDGWAFNLALGFRQLPHLADEARRFFALHGTSGWIVAGESPWPGAVPSGALSVLAAAPDAVMPAAQAAPTTPGAVAARRAQHGPSDPSPGVRIRAIDRRDVAAAVAWQRVVIEASGFGRAAAEALLALAPGMVADHRVRLFLAEVDGTPVGGAALFAHGGVGGLESAAVLPAWRGRGIHRALLAARASSARESGLDVLAAWAEAGGRSARNLGNLGMDALWQAGLYRWPAPGRPDRVPG